MWRWLLGVLVVANLFMMLLWRGDLDGVFPRGREPDRLQQQMNADRLRVIREERPDAGRDTDRRDGGATPAPRPGASRDVGGNAARDDARADARTDTRADNRTDNRADNRAEARIEARIEAQAQLSPPGETCVEFGALDESRARRARAWLADNVALVSGEVLNEERPTWIVYVAPAASQAEAQLRASLLRRQGIEDLFVWQDGPLKHAVSLGIFRNEEGARAALEHFSRQGVRNVLFTRRGTPDSRVAVRVRYPATIVDGRDPAVKLAQLQRELATQPQPCGSRPTVADARR